MASAAGPSQQKRKCKVLSIENKLKICELAKRGKTLQSLATEFDISRSTIHNNVKCEKQLQLFQKEVTEGECMKKRKTMKKSVLS